MRTRIKVAKKGRTSRENMIDDYTDAVQLVRKMEAQLPIPVRPTQTFIQAMRANGIQVSSEQDLQIGSVLYMGDEGGIGCAVEVPGEPKTVIVASVTHIHIKASHPLAEEILTYQIERTQRLSQTNKGCRTPTQFTVKPRKKGKRRRKR